ADGSSLRGPWGARTSATLLLTERAARAVVVRNGHSALETRIEARIGLIVEVRERGVKLRARPDAELRSEESLKTREPPAHLAQVFDRRLRRDAPRSRLDALPAEAGPKPRHEGPRLACPVRTRVRCDHHQSSTNGRAP